MEREDFLLLKRERWKIKVKKKYKGLLFKFGLENPENLSKKKARLIDDSDRSSIHSFKLNGKSIVLKEYKPRGLGKAWTNLWRPSKAVREFVLGNRLLEMGILVAEPLAVGEKRIFRLLRRCFLITKDISQSKKINHYILSLRHPLSKEKLREKRKLIRSLAKNIRKFHDKGFTHGDLNTSHIRVAGDRFYYFDFENARLKRRASDFRWIKDLARLNESMPSYITRTDKLRFYKEYAKGNRVKEGKIGRYLKRIQRRTLKKHPVLRNNFLY